MTQIANQMAVSMTPSPIQSIRQRYSCIYLPPLPNLLTNPGLNQISAQNSRLLISQRDGRILHFKAGRGGEDERTTPQIWSEKASDLLSDARPVLSHRQNESDQPRASDSSTNPMVCRGVPSNVHSFPVSH